MLRILLTAIFALALTACSTSRIIEADRWTTTQRKEQLVLTEMVSHPSTWDTGMKVVEGAMPGVYKAEREDADGVYFIGSGKPIWFTIPLKDGDRTMIRQGGIYVPHDRSVPPHFVFVVESTPGVAGGIHDYINEQTVQNIALRTNNFSAGANIVGSQIAAGLVSAFSTINDGKFTRLFPITEPAARQRILAGIQPTP